MEFLGWLVVGIALGAVASWLVLRARQGGRSAEQVAEAERARSDAAQARAEVSQIRAEAARSGTDVALARAEAATAREERALAIAELAAAQAAAAAAHAERDAAVARASEIATDREHLAAQFKALSAETIERQGRQFEATAEARLKATEQVLIPVKESLQRFEDRLRQVEQERIAMTTDLRAQVAEVRHTGEDLRRETAALVTALRKPQVRGAWGELQLKRVVELAGMVEHCDFVQQATARTSAGATIRPDLKVTLSEGRFIYVDSKVPLTAFLDAHEAADEGERGRLLTQFARNVQSHVDQLSAKDYFKSEAGSTPEFVVLFLAGEALAYEAYQQLPSLLEYAAERGVMIATPSSLIAMLKTAAYAWSQASLADSAQQVFSLGRELYDRLATLGKHVDKLGRSLGGAVAAYNDAVGSIEGRVFPTARKLRDLHVTTRELDAVKASEASVRPLTAPELVADAVDVPAVIGRRGGETSARPQPEVDELVAGDRLTARREVTAETA